MRDNKKSAMKKSAELLEWVYIVVDRVDRRGISRKLIFIIYSFCVSVVRGGAMFCACCRHGRNRITERDWGRPHRSAVVDNRLGNCERLPSFLPPWFVRSLSFSLRLLLLYFSTLLHNTWVRRTWTSWIFSSPAAGINASRVGRVRTDHAWPNCRVLARLPLTHRRSHTQQLPIIFKPCFSNFFFVFTFDPY